jgi:diguanylate cyclase (GGDEF)-like protein/PAS domain S-box-containing protein
VGAAHRGAVVSTDLDSIPPALVEGFLKLCEGDFAHRMPRNLLRDKDDTAAFFFNAIAEELDRILRVSREQEQRLLRSEENFRKLFDAAPVPMILIDEEGCVRMYNDQAAALLEVGRQAIVGASAREFFADENEWAMLFERLGKEGVVDARAVRLRTRGGHTPWSLLNARTLMLDARRTGVLTLADLTEQKRIEERLRRLAARDELTDTLSRGRFFEVVREELSRATRYSRPVALAMLDLDHFKSINDRFGHRAGDDVLRAIAGLMTRGLRSQDQVGRYGGEEFAIMLPETLLDCARDVLERTRQGIAELRHDLGGHKGTVTVSVTVSVGVVSALKGESIEAALARADKALYRAKGDGRNRVTTE